MRHQIKPGYGLQKYSGGQKTDAGGATGASERAEADVPAAALAPKPTPAQVEASAAAARHVRAARKPLTEAEKAKRRAEVPHRTSMAIVSIAIVSTAIESTAATLGLPSILYTYSYTDHGGHSWRTPARGPTLGPPTLTVVLPWL